MTQNSDGDQWLKTSQTLVTLYVKACRSFFSHENAFVENCKELLNIGHIYQEWGMEISKNPQSLWQAQMQFVQDYYEVLMNFSTNLLEKDHKKGNGTKTLFVPSSNDHRFRSADWREDPFFYFLQQNYLLIEDHVLKFIEKNPSKDPKRAKQVQFFTRQWLHALSPSNFILTNPSVLKRTIEEKGDNLIHGFNNFLKDFLWSDGAASISMTNFDAFTVGKNIATSKGKIIYQNKMMQLIQYAPLTDTVYQRPLLIVPPWINKYYILDLRENNSLVRWAVSQGFTVFMISWANPDESFEEITFEDYLSDGVLAALDAINLATSEKKINTLGFCIGGTLLAIALAYLKVKKDHRISSATFLATLTDFSNPGEIDVFIDEEQINSLDHRMEEKGYLDGHVLMTAFNLLRENELLWPYYINNYLYGQHPIAFDLLYWNCDSTNLPCKMVSYYIRNLYLKNQLGKPNELRIKNTPIDLSAVVLPCYFLSTQKDHIAPWESIYQGAKQFQGSNTFVLAESGHIAGVINPPNHAKYGFYTNDNQKDPLSSNQWLQTADYKKGSWWEHWLVWQKKFGGNRCPARIPGEGRLNAIQDAPGDYVKKRI